MKSLLAEVSVTIEKRLYGLGLVTPLSKTAPLVYNIHSESNILSFELFLPSPHPKKELLRMRLTVPR